MAVDLKGTSYGCNLLAREIALDMAERIYRPDIAEHVRGIANNVADALSRQFVHGNPEPFPCMLQDVPEEFLDRHVDLFRTLAQ